MTKTLHLVLLVLATQLVLGLPYVPIVRQGPCHKSYRVTGTGIDGQPKSYNMRLRRPLIEPPGFDPVLAEEGDRRTYAGYYQIIGAPTFKQNCAGLVMERHFGIGNTYFEADQFVRELLSVFAEDVTGRIYAAGDVVVFGANKHVAYVTGPGSTASRVRIVSKDNQESVLAGELTITTTSNVLGNDPIKGKNGSPRVFRFRSKPQLTEVTQGNCDPTVLPDLTITIDVNEILKSGTMRQLNGAAVELTLSNGEKLLATSGADGRASVVITDTPPGRGAAARSGISVKVTIQGFYDKSDTISADLLKENSRIWNATLTRKPDNPEEADPNIMPGGTTVDLKEWEKTLREIEGRIAAAEAKRTEFLKKSTNSKNSADKVVAAEKKARSLLEDLKKLKPAVDRVGRLCTEASKTNKDLEALAKAIDDQEKEATKLTDAILELADKCATAADVKKIRDDTAKLKKLVDDFADPVKEARRLNNELKRLETESLKELPELSKGAGIIKGIHEQDDIAGKAFKEAMDDFGALSPIENEIRTAKFTLSTELFKHRRAYPTYPIPTATAQQLDALNARIESLMTGVSTGQAPMEIAKTLGELARLAGEGDALVKQYQNAVCKITARDDLLSTIAGSVTFAGLGLQTILNTESKVQQCETRLDCESQLKKINEALDIGDLEGATTIIARIKGPPGCNTTEVEKRWTEISNRIAFDLATARNRWRDIGTTCDFRGAYEAALVIQKQYPRHPWIVASFANIDRGYRAEEQIRALLNNLIAADKARNYDEAERLLGQIDAIAAAYPCKVAEAKRLRTEYGKGKPASAEEETKCRELLAQVRQAFGGKALVEASKKLAEAQKTCSNVSPALFTDLQAAEREFEQAIQQALADIRSAAARCEYEGAYNLAKQINQIRPALVSTAELERLRPQAEAQDKARVFLIPGLDAIQRKDVKGAIASLNQAKGVPGVPQCLLDQINKLLRELEKRRSFTDLTEKVQAATQKCDYKEAARLVAQIKLITPREDYITDWLRTNEQILNDLQTRERNALSMLKQAEGLANTADKDSSIDPINWTSVSATVKQAMDLLLQADKEAPKCLAERQQMELLKQRLLAIAKRKPAEIASSIVLLIDTSGSMAANNKMAQAKDAAKRAARQVSKTTEIAVLQFDGGCGPGAMRPASGFTTDLNTLLAAIDTLQPGNGTPMYISTAAAVRYAQDNGRGKSRNVILMSDGADTCRDQQAQAATSIRSSSIPVSTIGFDVGNNQQAQGDLSNLASMTGGRSFSASAADPREIIRAFNLAMLPSLLKDFDFGDAGGAVAGYFSQAKALVNQQNVGGALMLLQQANSLAPNSPNLNYNLSLLYESQDQLIPAVNHANNYLRLAPGAVDRADVENRVRDIQQELQKNPRAVMDPSGCRDVLIWAQAERETARRTGNTARIQSILEVTILAQRGDCDNARSKSTEHKRRFP